MRTEVENASEISEGPARVVSAAPSRRKARLRLVASLARTLGGAALTLLVISLITFAAMNYKSPEDIARSALGRETSQEQIDAYVEANNLDDPFLKRYVTWVRGAVHGDFGTSALTGRPVSEEVMPRLARTVSLTLAALLIAAPLSIMLGVFVARRPRSVPDRLALIGSVVLAATPEFVIGIVFLAFFAAQLGWFPVNSAGAFEFGTFSEQVKAYVLPVMVLVLTLIPYIMRLTRAASRDVLRAPYVQAATLRGLPNRTVVWDHAVRNAAAPIIAVLALILVSLLGGVIVVENVFGFPGVGQALVESVGAGDAMTVQAIAVLLGAMFIVVSLVADLAALYFTPRLRASAR
jgi:peptide/nickel transport system permease protein